MLLGGLLVLAGCGQSADSMVKEQIDTMNELADAIESDSAEADIEAIKDRMEALAKKIKEIPEEERKELLEKYKKELAAAGEKLARAMVGKMGEAMEGFMKGTPEGMPKGMPKQMPKMPGQ
jgi:acyl-CoA reductase-like NAD-dependent aldehyde dehydrogenase